MNSETGQDAKAIAAIVGPSAAMGVEACTSRFLRSRFAFGTGGAPSVFYSGGNGAAKAAAETYAAQNGAKMILDTPGGKILNRITGANVFGQPLYRTLPGTTDRMWRWGSKYFAQAAQGEANVFLSGAVRSTSTWRLVEQNILLQNENVILKMHRVPCTQ
jgi:hypothetical protein